MAARRPGGTGSRGAGAEGWGAAGNSVAGWGHKRPRYRRKLFPEVSRQISLQTSTGVQVLKKLLPLSWAFPAPEDLQRSAGLCPSEVTSVLAAPGRGSPRVWSVPWEWPRFRRPRPVCVHDMVPWVLSAQRPLEKLQSDFVALSPCGLVDWVPCWALTGGRGFPLPPPSAGWLSPSAHLNVLFLCSVKETPREARCQLSLLLPDRRSRGVESASCCCCWLFSCLSLLFL